MVGGERDEGGRERAGGGEREREREHRLKRIVAVQPVLEFRVYVN